MYQRGSSGFTLLIGLVIISILSGSFYFLVFKRTNPEVRTSVSISTPTPTINVVDQTKDWKIYDNEKYGFTLKYPPTFTYVEEVLDPPDIFLISTAFKDPTKIDDLNNGFTVEVKDAKLEEALVYYKWSVQGHIAASLKSETTFIKDGYSGVNMVFEPEEKSDVKPFNIIVINNNQYSYTIWAPTNLSQDILSTLKISN